MASNCPTCESTDTSINLVTDNPWLLIKLDCCMKELLGIGEEETAFDYVAFCLTQIDANNEPTTSDINTFCGTETVVTAQAAKQFTASSVLTAAAVDVNEVQTITISGQEISFVFSGASLFNRLANRVCSGQYTFDGIFCLPYGNGSYDVYMGKMKLVSANYSRVAGDTGDAGFVISYNGLQPQAITIGG